MERLRAQVQTQGWQWLDENIFRDDVAIVASLNCPGLDWVLITVLDRLARNYVHQMLLIEEFERYGCAVEFLDRPMSHDPHDQLVRERKRGGSAGPVATTPRTRDASKAGRLLEV